MAVRELGWDQVEVTKIDIDAIARGEYAENVERKEFTPSEAVAIKRAVEKLEKPKAKQKQEASRAKKGEKIGAHKNGQIQGSTNFVEPTNKNQSGDNVAKATGLSRETLRQAVAITRAAEEEPEKFADLVEQMDETKKVNPAFKELKKRQSSSQEKTWTVQQDIAKFQQLKKRLQSNWVDERDRRAMRDFFQHLAVEICPGDRLSDFFGGPATVRQPRRRRRPSGSTKGACIAPDILQIVDATNN
jgi:hypothetical protein